MMYNPYNWNIRQVQKSNVEMEMPVFPGSMMFDCILNELSQVSNELELTRIKYAELKKEFEETEKQLNNLKNRKSVLISKMCDD